MELTEIAIKASEYVEDEDSEVPADVEEFWEGAQSTDGFWYTMSQGTNPVPIINRMYANEDDRIALLEAIRLVEEFEQDYYDCFGMF